MRRGSRPRGFGPRGRAGLASTIGPVLVGVFFAFAWNMAASHAPTMPQPDPGLAPTVGTAVDQAADQTWASVTPISTRLPDRRIPSPAGSARSGGYRLRTGRLVWRDPRGAGGRLRPRVRLSLGAALSRGGQEGIGFDHPAVGAPQVRRLKHPDRSGPGQGETGARICRTCRWLIGTRKPTG